MAASRPQHLTDGEHDALSVKSNALFAARSIAVNRLGLNEAGVLVGVLVIGVEVVERVNLQVVSHRGELFKVRNVVLVTCDIDAKILASKFVQLLQINVVPQIIAL